MIYLQSSLATKVQPLNAHIKKTGEEGLGRSPLENKGALITLG